MAETRLATMDVTAMSRLALTFDQNLLLMSGAVLPAIILCVMQYFFLEFLGERFQLVAISAALILAFRAGIATVGSKTNVQQHVRTCSLLTSILAILTQYDVMSMLSETI